MIEADAGVPYGLGTDSGPPGRFPGFFEQWEMELMVEYGMRALEVLKSATATNAEVFGYADKIGRVKQGLLADLIAVEGDPSSDIKIIRKIKLVMKDGIIYKQ